jgi:hypothetical protein
MEREKPLPWIAFLGVAITMVSLLVVFGINLYLTRESSGIYNSQPSANLAGMFLLILGIILMGVGFRRVK